MTEKQGVDAYTRVDAAASERSGAQRMSGLRKRLELAMKAPNGATVTTADPAPQSNECRPKLEHDNDENGYDVERLEERQRRGVPGRRRGSDPDGDKAGDEPERNQAPPSRSPAPRGRRSIGRVLGAGFHFGGACRRKGCVELAARPPVIASVPS
jgi:hypothetical protein